MTRCSPCGGTRILRMSGWSCSAHGPHGQLDEHAGFIEEPVESTVTTVTGRVLAWPQPVAGNASGGGKQP